MTNRIEHPGFNVPPPGAEPSPHSGRATQDGVRRGVAGFNGFAEYYRGDATAAFADVDDAALQAELAAAVETAANVVTEAATWLESQRATANQDFAFGAERFARMLVETEAVTVLLDRLEEIGRADLESNQKALAEACASFAPGAGR